MSGYARRPFAHGLAWLNSFARAWSPQLRQRSAASRAVTLFSRSRGSALARRSARPLMKTSTASEHIFVDTWGWLVLAHRKDPNHSRVRDLRRKSAQQGSRWTTTDYVLDETATRLFATAPFSEAVRFFDGIFESQALGSLTIETVGPERFRAAWKLRLKYKDKPRISFTDLTSFAVMRDAGIRYVITGDVHFGQIGLGFHTLP